MFHVDRQMRSTHVRPSYENVVLIALSFFCFVFYYDEPKVSLYGRETDREAPVDATRDLIYFSPNKQRGGVGGGGYAVRLFLLFSFPCSADHERDWPPCKVVFSGWQPIR